MTPVRQRMTEDMQVRNLSPHTQASYVQQVSLFARYFGKSPEVLGAKEIRAYQAYLTNEKKLASSSILIAVSALCFHFKVTLHRDWTLWSGARWTTTTKVSPPSAGTWLRNVFKTARPPAEAPMPTTVGAGLDGFSGISQGSLNNP